MKIEQLLEDKFAGKCVYHGTSKKSYAKIAKIGLVPQKKPNSFFRGNESTLKGMTELQVFYTNTADHAEYYSSEQADHHGTDPVVLQIPVSAFDRALCFPDDDYLIVLVADKFSADEEEARDALSDIGQNKSSSLEGFTTEVLDELIIKWRKHFKFTEPFGYRGTIGIDNIKVVVK